MAHHTRSSALRNIAVAILAFAFVAEAAFEKGHVHLPFTRIGRAKGPVLSNRDADNSLSSVKLGNNLYPYVVNVEVGTPPQAMFLAVSTTTGLSWLQDARSSRCDAGKEYIYPNNDPYANPIVVDIPSPCQSGAYNKSLSSTFLNANQLYDDFSVDSFPHISVYGKNMTDKLVLGGLEFPDMPMGLAVTASETFTGVLGLGLYTKSSEYNDEFPHPPRFLDRLVEGGHAKTRAFSIWLDDSEGKFGQLLFGAIDQSGYEGDLLRIKTSTYEYVSSGSFAVTVSTFEAAANSDSELEDVRTNDFPLHVAISPGELFSYLPEGIFNKIVTLTGATYNYTAGATTIPCDAAKTNNAQFRLRLDGSEGPLLNFQTADLIIPHDLFSHYSYRQNKSMCAFALQQSDSYYEQYYNLGGALLRRSYLVFDLENQEVAVAPVKFKSTGGDQPSPTIVAFASSGAPIPSASLYCGDYSCGEYCAYESCVTPTPAPTSTGDPRVPDSPDGSGTRSGSAPYDHWRNIAIGVGVSLGVTALVAGIAITIIWGRICRGAGYAAGKKDTEGAESEDAVPSGGPVMSTAGTPRNMMQSSPVVLPPGTLPVIREEDPGSRAPQLPVVATAGPITPPEPITPSNRDSIAVSAISAEHGPLPESTPEVTTGPEAEVPKPRAEVPAPGSEAEGAKSTDVVEATGSEGDRPRSPKGKEVEIPETREV